MQNVLRTMRASCVYKLICYERTKIEYCSLKVVRRSYMYTIKVVLQNYLVIISVRNCILNLCK